MVQQGQQLFESGGDGQVLGAEPVVDTGLAGGATLKPNAAGHRVEFDQRSVGQGDTSWRSMRTRPEYTRGIGQNTVGDTMP